MTSLKSPPLSSSVPTGEAATSFLRRDAGLSPARFISVVGPCALFCLAVLLLAPWVGSTGVTLNNVIAGVSPDREIIMIARLPRVLFGALVGGADALAFAAEFAVGAGVEQREGGAGGVAVADFVVGAVDGVWVADDG